MALPKFKDIKIFHCDGFDPKTVLVQVLDFLSDPVHGDFQLVETHVNYFQPTTVPPYIYESTTDVEASVWVEVSLIYTEG